MNALIHSFDRIEPPPNRRRPWHLLKATYARFRAVLRESRDRQALAHISEWSERMVRDVGLTQEEARRPEKRPLSDGRWLVEQARRRERS
jgi:hypothetical protein